MGFGCQRRKEKGREKERGGGVWRELPAGAGLFRCFQVVASQEKGKERNVWGKKSRGEERNILRAKIPCDETYFYTSPFSIDDLFMHIGEIRLVDSMIQLILKICSAKNPL